MCQHQHSTRRGLQIIGTLKIFKRLRVLMFPEHTNAQDPARFGGVAWRPQGALKMIERFVKASHRCERCAKADLGKPKIRLDINRAREQRYAVFPTHDLAHTGKSECHAGRRAWRPPN